MLVLGICNSLRTERYFTALLSQCIRWSFSPILNQHVFDEPPQLCKFISEAASAIPVRSVSSPASTADSPSSGPDIVCGLVSLNCSAKPVVVGISAAKANVENRDMQG